MRILRLVVWLTHMVLSLHSRSRARTTPCAQVDKAPVEVVCVLKGLLEDGQMRLSDGRRILCPTKFGAVGSPKSRYSACVRRMRVAGGTVTVLPSRWRFVVGVAFSFSRRPPPPPPPPLPRPPPRLVLSQRPEALVKGTSFGSTRISSSLRWRTVRGFPSWAMTSSVSERCCVCACACVCVCGRVTCASSASSLAGVLAVVVDGDHVFLDVVCVMFRSALCLLRE